MSEPHQISRLRPALSITYLMVWGLLGTLAVGYLALLALRPDLAARMTVVPIEGSPEGNRGQRAMTRALAELGDVKKALGRFENELAGLRQHLDSETKSRAALEARVVALEAAQRGGTTPIAKAPPLLDIPTSANVATVSIDPGLAATENERLKAPRERSPPLPTPKPAAAAAANASAIVTNSIEPKAAEPKSPPVAIVIGAGPSVDAVRLSWQLLQDGHAKALKSLEPRYVESNVEPGILQLLAGPFASREEATRACERLKARRLPCAVANAFGGQPL